LKLTLDKPAKELAQQITAERKLSQPENKSQNSALKYKENHNALATIAIISAKSQQYSPLKSSHHKLRNKLI